MVLRPPKTTLTGGAAAQIWPHSWANCLFSAAGLTLEVSEDNATWYPATRLDGSGAATSGAAEMMSVMLISGLWIRATGAGTVSLFPGSAGVFQTALANSPA